MHVLREASGMVLHFGVCIDQFAVVRVSPNQIIINIIIIIIKNQPIIYEMVKNIQKLEST